MTDGWVGSQAGVLMVRRSDISLTGVTRMGDVRGLLSLLFMSWFNNEFEEVPPALSAVTGVQIFWNVGSYVVGIGISSDDVGAHCLTSATIFFVWHKPSIAEQPRFPAQCVLWQSRDSDVRMLPKTCDTIWLDPVQHKLSSEWNVHECAILSLGAMRNGSAVLFRRRVNSCEHNS